PLQVQISASAPSAVEAPVTLRHLAERPPTKVVVVLVLVPPRVMTAALPALTETVRVLPFTATGVVVGAASEPLDCTLWPPIVMPVLAVSPPGAVRSNRLPEAKLAPRLSCTVVAPLLAGSLTLSRTTVIVPSACRTA